MQHLRLAVSLATRVADAPAREPAPRATSGRIAVRLAAGLGFALSVSMAAGQATRPAGADTLQGPAPATTAPASLGRESRGGQASVESQPLRRDAAAQPSGENGAARRDRRGNPVAPPTTQQPTTKQDALFDFRRVALALCAVIGLIFVLHWIAKRVFPSVAAAKSSQAIRVLSRSVLSPRQQVLLVRVGKRVIVVGDSGAQMNALAEINDPDEVASLIAEIESERRPISSAFGGFFGRARETFEPRVALDGARGEAQDEEGSDPDPAPGREQPPVDLGLNEARGELRGLMDKVKELSQQFRRS